MKVFIKPIATDANGNILSAAMGHGAPVIYVDIDSPINRAEVMLSPESARTLAGTLSAYADAIDALNA